MPGAKAKENKRFPLFAVYLPPPDHYLKPAQKMWRRGRYGLWIGPNHDGLQDPHDPLQTAQRDAAKSIIARLMISQDAKNFLQGPANDKQRQVYEWISCDNNQRLCSRTEHLVQVGDGLIGRKYPLADRMLNAVVDMSRDFVAGCLSTDPDKLKRIDTELGGNLDRIRRINFEITVHGAGEATEVAEGVSAEG